MSTISLRLPESLHRQLRELSKKEGVCINQLAASAVAEKLAALMTVEYLEERASRAGRSQFEASLAKIPDAEPDKEDRHPANI